MFGVFLKETATDYQILVNVKPYRTDLRILSKEKYSKASEIPVGVKVEFNESTINDNVGRVFRLWLLSYAWNPR